MMSTLAYFDVFDFPVTQDEMVRFLHSAKAIPTAVIDREIQKVPHMRVQSRVLYFLPTRKHIVAGRLEKERISKEKIHSNTRVLTLLGRLPTIAFLGVSGSLAMKNGDRESDIDLFIITFPHTVWITRAVIWLVLLVMGRRRKRNTKGIDTICVNMMMDREHLLFPVERQDIYTAHEIMQVIPVIDKYHTYSFFVRTNNWIERYLANSFIKTTSNTDVPGWVHVCWLCISPVESLVRILQLVYMKRHQTREKVTSTYIAFHPYDYRDTIIQAFKERLRDYAI